MNSIFLSVPSVTGWKNSDGKVEASPLIGQLETLIRGILDKQRVSINQPIVSAMRVLNAPISPVKILKVWSAPAIIKDRDFGFAEASLILTAFSGKTTVSSLPVIASTGAAEAEKVLRISVSAATSKALGDILSGSRHTKVATYTPSCRAISKASGV